MSLQGPVITSSQWLVSYLLMLFEQSQALATRILTATSPTAMELITLWQLGSVTLFGVRIGTGE